MTNHPNRSKISYTFFDTQDSLNHTSGLTIGEARDLQKEKNSSRFEIMSDGDFVAYIDACNSDKTIKCHTVDGITKII